MRIEDATVRLRLATSAFTAAVTQASAATDRFTLVLLRRRLAELLRKLLALRG